MDEQMLINGLSPEDAAELMERCRRFDEAEELVNSVNYLATLREMDPREMINEYLELDERIAKDALEEQFGDDLQGLEAALGEYSKKRESLKTALMPVTAAQKEKKLQLSQRIADEFMELNKEFPEICDISLLPRQVLEDAGERNLLFSYLLYLHRLTSAQNAAKLREANNAHSSVGTLAESADIGDVGFVALMRSLRGKP